MEYRIILEPGYVRAELSGRETADETREFLGAVAAETAKHRCSRVLISVHRSKPVFTVDRYGLSSYLEIALKAPFKIALMGDSDELRIAHQYVESLARQRGVNLRTFRDEANALRWLRAESAQEPPRLKPGGEVLRDDRSKHTGTR